MADTAHRLRPPAPPRTARSSGQPTLVAQLVTEIESRIASRSLGIGARLPSIRAVADQRSVSKATVVDAYARLTANGVISPRRGSGFFVSGPTPPLSLAPLGPRLARALDPLWVSRQSLEAAPHARKPGCGWLPERWMPQSEIRRALRSVARAGSADLADYGQPLGHAPLRYLLSRRLAERGIPAAADQILLTDSGTQAIDLVCRLLLKAGDTVVVDDPCYFNFHAMLRAQHIQIVGVPFSPQGPDLARFAAVLAEHRPRLYLTIGTIHNPTGAVLAPAVAHRVLKLAEQYDCLIIEDDIFADFEEAPSTRLAAFDGLDRVIYLGSYSKTLSAAARCGYVAIRADWVDRLTDLKLATSFGNNALSAAVVHEVLRDGAYPRHIASLRSRLAAAAARTSTRLEALGFTSWTRHMGGLFLWMRLPEGLDSMAVAEAALAEDVVLAPGDVFSLSRTMSGFMRFNVTQCSEPGVFAVLERALRASARARHADSANPTPHCS